MTFIFCFKYLPLKQIILDSSLDHNLLNINVFFQSIDHLLGLYAYKDDLYLFKMKYYLKGAKFLKFDSL